MPPTWLCLCLFIFINNVEILLTIRPPRTSEPYKEVFLIYIYDQNHIVLSNFLSIENYFNDED